MRSASIGILSGLVMFSSLAVACGGVYVASKAAGLLQERQAECVELREKLRRSDAEVDLLRAMLKEAQSKAPVQKQAVGAEGTLSRKAGNYLNVKAPSDTYWLGQQGRDAHGHAVFVSPEWSLRAGTLVLRSYYQRHGIKTVRGIVERFSTCNHEEYTTYLCDRLKLDPDEEFNVMRRMPELVRHMVRFESGSDVRPAHIHMLDVLSSI
ncbi:MAG: hypothetical protein IKS68_02340 [Mailhella sp.]|nr:hypothetical protein [Mailhella sp.]